MTANGASRWTTIGGCSKALARRLPVGLELAHHPDEARQFRAAFHGFDFARVACFDEGDVERLLQDAGIVRHRGKIEAVINNAGRAGADRRKGLARRLCPGASSHGMKPPHLASTSPASIAMSKDLKKRGWKFVGPTTVHAFMQAMG
jgi:DNA-3-methyladenine glycosylase I